MEGRASLWQNRWYLLDFILEPILTSACSERAPSYRLPILAVSECTQQSAVARRCQHTPEPLMDAYKIGAPFSNLLVRVDNLVFTYCARKLGKYCFAPPRTLLAFLEDKKTFLRFSIKA